MNTSRGIRVAAPGNLDKQPRRRNTSAKNGLRAGAAFTADGRHLDDSPVLIDRNDGDDRGFREEDVVEGSIDIGKYLARMALDAFEIGREPPELARRQSDEKPVTGDGRKGDHPLSATGILAKQLDDGGSLIREICRSCR